MRKTILKSVYKPKNQNGVRKTNLSLLREKKGIYFIYENEDLVYVGMSTSNLYKTCLRHFQQWNDSEQENRISYESKIKRGYEYFLQIVFMESDEEILNAEQSFILERRPRDNKKLFNKLAYSENKREPDLRLIKQILKLPEEDIFAKYDKADLELSQFIAKPKKVEIKKFIETVLVPYCNNATIQDNETFDEFDERTSQSVEFMCEDFINKLQITPKSEAVKIRKDLIFFAQNKISPF